LAFPSDVGDACTNIQQVAQEEQEEQEEEEGTAHVGTWRNVRVGLTSLVVCINDKFHDLRERNVIMRSEI
jgi:hypothetical protein